MINHEEIDALCEGAGGMTYAALEAFGNSSGIVAAEKIKMLRTVMIMRAIDRLTEAVQENTKAVRDAGGVQPFGPGDIGEDDHEPLDDLGM